MSDLQPSRETSGPQRLRGVRRMLWVLTAVQVLCAAGLAMDLYSEFPDPRLWPGLPAIDLHHLVAEIIMVTLVLTGLAVTRYVMRRLNAERHALRDQLGSLRGAFDSIIHARFDLWNLTPAQRDVALLTLRGLRLSEIATARGCAEGTIKAHMSAIFRASDVHTRSEFLGLFMDELLDFGATEAEMV